MNLKENQLKIILRFPKFTIYFWPEVNYNEMYRYEKADAAAGHIFDIHINAASFVSLS